MVVALQTWTRTRTGDVLMVLVTVTERPKTFRQVAIAQDFVSLPRDVQSDWSASLVGIIALSFLHFTQKVR